MTKATTMTMAYTTITQLKSLGLQEEFAVVNGKTSSTF